MNLRQQLITHRVEEIEQKLSVSNDVAFLRFAHSVITGQSIHAFDDTGLVDGAQEKQIDIISIEQDDNQATIFVVQGKSTGGFSSNTVIQMGNGLDWLISAPATELQKLSNTKLRDKALEVRSILNSLGPSNLTFVLALVTNGLTSIIRPEDEINQEIHRIVQRYDNGTFEGFEFQLWGADELIDKLNKEERGVRRLDADIKIKYDTNNPSLLKYHSAGFKGVICTSDATEIARIVNDDTSGAVFDQNIRRFLGTRGGVNSDILATCTDATEGKEFWFLNNGITIVCDHCDPVTDPDNPHLKLKNMQIVNGCQTATTLAIAAKNGSLAPDVRVLLRVYEIGTSEIVSRIVLTTNNQNKISSRDLRANDPVQLDMERGFLQYGLHYERKPRQYDTNASVGVTTILPNESVAQAYLAVVLRKPSDARRRKYKVWGEMYDSVFGGSHVIEPYAFAALISRVSEKWLKTSSYASSADDIERKIANNGTYHVARLVAGMWHGTNWSSPGTLASKISILMNQPETVSSDISRAFAVLVDIIRNDSRFLSDVDNALKSSVVDQEIERVISHQTTQGRLSI